MTTARILTRMTAIASGAVVLPVKTQGTCTCQDARGRPKQNSITLMYIRLTVLQETRLNSKKRIRDHNKDPE